MSSSFAALRQRSVSSPFYRFSIGVSKTEPEPVRDRQRDLLARVSIRIAAKGHDGEPNEYLKYAIDEALDLDAELDRAKSLLKEASKRLTAESDQILRYKIDELLAN